MTSKVPTRVCFVGNISYDISEQQIVSIFSEVGPVIDFRMVFDKETGKSKGFGFVQFHDIETASSAVRNLNGYSISGRGLRVDFAENEKEDQKDTPVNNARIAQGQGQRMEQRPDQRMDQRQGGYQQNQGGYQSQQNAPQGFNQSQQRNQYSQPQGPGQYGQQQGGQARSSNPVTAVMSSVTPKQISDLLSQMKIYAEANPDKARALLEANPQLSFALFQAMLVSNVVEQAVLQSVLENTKPVEPMHHQQQQPPIQHQHQQPPPQHHQQQQAQQVPEQMTPEQEQQKQLLLQVMALTEDQILALPNEQRQQVIALRAQLNASANM